MNGRLLFSLICIISTFQTASFSQPAAEKGLLDLRRYGIPGDQFISLNGEWEFYWKKLLTPADFLDSAEMKPDIFGKVPAYWSDYSNAIPGIEGDGFATYRLRIILPERSRNSLAIRIPAFDSSSRIYINGKNLLTAGLPGEKESETIPGYKPATIIFDSQKDTVEIVVNISNFHHRRGGFWLPADISNAEFAARINKQSELLASTIAGMLFSFSILFLIFFMVFRRDRTMLFFSVAGMAVLARSVSTGLYQVQNFFDIKWIWLIRTEYIGSYLALIFGLLYFQNLYPTRVGRFVNPVIIVIFSLCLAIVLATPVTIFSHTILIFMPAIAFILAFYMLRSFRAAILLKKHDIFMAVGFLALLAATVNDIALANSHILIFPFYIIPYSVVFFIMMQAIVLIYRWVNSFNEESRLKNEIEFMNRNLEEIVIDRTAELTNHKSEIEKQKFSFEEKNRELEKNIAIKNRIFSIIEHDLKAPVLSISRMIDQLKEQSDKDSFTLISGSLGEQASFATALIDNLLLWGAGQKNRIEYNPERLNLTDIVLSQFNLFRETAQRKQIHLTYSHKGDPSAICDKELISMVIRNLLSNSVKFTNRKGKITVTAEEPVLKDGTVILTIKDNGVGISPEKLELLSRNELIESSEGTENERGTGLGLQLCFELIRINKGSISIDSSPGGGTSVSLVLPAPSAGRRF